MAQPVRSIRQRRSFDIPSWSGVVTEPPPIDPEIHRIFSELRRRDLPRAALGRHLGLDPKQMNRLENGQRRLQRHEHAAALEFLGLAAPPAQVAGGTIVPMPGLVPLFGWVGAASDGRLTLAEQSLRGYVPMHPNQANVRDAFALEVADVSMSPRYEPGEIVYLAPNRMPRTGTDCVVVTTDGEGLLKRFVSRGADQMVLHQLNPNKQLTLDLRAVAQVHSVVGRG
jgi:phage repressor protein C with HTH and peptisase S24 domain